MPPRHTGGAHGEDAQKQAEEDHGAQGGQAAVEHLGDGHDEEHLGEHRAAQ